MPRVARAHDVAARPRSTAVRPSTGDARDDPRHEGADHDDHRSRHRTRAGAASVGGDRRLPEKLRVVVVLAGIEEHDLNEVARLLDVPLGTVKSRMFTARARMREHLQCTMNSQQR
ncbi:MAG: hypothetical protein DMF99_29265 [Acidobacteria bacterium]|nr:MAG: hypothetical protein DMF99_29265 [Acidobacteriota bacterium]